MKRADELKEAAVLGAGTMGAGIAQVAAQAGLSVRLQDVDLERANAGVERIRAMLEKGIARGKVTPEQRDDVLSRITPHGDVASAVGGSEVVIEAAPEDVELKRDLFRRVDEAVDGTTLLATNTSSLPITEIAAAVSSPERFVGLHFFNPPPLMKLLEVVRGEATSEDVTKLSVDLGRRLGKEPIVVKDSPGFASSRLGLALGLEAMRMVEDGVASAADIDTAMELGYRHPMGPLKLTDLVGLDVRLSIAEHLTRELDEVRFAPPAILHRLVEEGHHGQKTGRGFYDWVDGKPVARDESKG